MKKKKARAAAYHAQRSGASRDSLERAESILTAGVSLAQVKIINLRSPRCWYCMENM